jgi:K+ transporter
MQHFFCVLLTPLKNRAVTFVWLLLLAGTGIHNVTKHPGIFRAFDPSRAIMCKFMELLHLPTRLIE